LIHPLTEREHKGDPIIQGHTEEPQPLKEVTGPVEANITCVRNHPLDGIPEPCNADSGQSFIELYERRIKELEDENKLLRSENSQMTKDYASLESLLRYEIRRLNGELSAQEQRYQNRREEELKLEHERREMDRRSNKEIWQMMIAGMISVTNVRKRKRESDERRHDNND
jgi:predicted RNase H-like nuclease (RuvC/YqgF family)